MTIEKSRRRTRHVTVISIIILTLLLMLWAFWPRPIKVDVSQVQKGELVLTVSEEGRTRVRDAYVVAAPIAGRLMRVEADAGDEVIGGETIIASMLPMPPSVMDIRTREQSRAAVASAEAALRVSKADLNSALADQDLAEAAASRQRQLLRTNVAAQEAVDVAEGQLKSANARVDMAKSAISMRQAELANARARLIEFSSAKGALGPAGGSDTSEGTLIPLESPISGRVLRILQESETTVQAGQPILEIGDISDDLEIVAELLSTDAVKVSVGDKVLIDHWGGEDLLEGVVERVEPWGFTKYSALGVEEQRVNTIIRFASPIEQRRALGHGYRVEVGIVIWEKDDLTIIPSSALFRHDGTWAVFSIVGNKARLVPVSIIENNGILAAVKDGITPGTTVILYPSSSVSEGARVLARNE